MLSHFQRLLWLRCYSVTDLIARVYNFHRRFKMEQTITVLRRWRLTRTILRLTAMFVIQCENPFLCAIFPRQMGLFQLHNKHNYGNASFFLQRALGVQPHASTFLDLAIAEQRYVIECWSISLFIIFIIVLGKLFFCRCSMRCVRMSF